METDESAAPQRSAHVHPGGVAVHVPSSLSAEEPAAFREQHDDMVAAMAAAPSPGYSPFEAPVLAAAHPVSMSLPASLTGFSASRTEAELHQHAVTDDAPPRVVLPPRAPAAVAGLTQPDKVVFRSHPIAAAPLGNRISPQD